jgi:exodeoxyribonuclease V gamma subunit
MSTLYLGTDPETLAEKLASLMEQTVRAGNLFAPVQVIVPNRYLGKWLRLWLARRLGVAVNLQFTYLEAAGWELLQELDDRRAVVQLLDDSTLRFLILALLLQEEEGTKLAPLRDYLERSGRPARRHLWRRAWQLADRLAELLRDYEYHRQDELVGPWLNGLAQEQAPDLQLAQQELYRRIMATGGLRDLLSSEPNQRWRTLPQYASELMARPAPDLLPPARQIHLFGITQISRMHTRLLRWLGQWHDLRLYHLNPLCAQIRTLPKSATKVCQQLRILADPFRAPELRLSGHAAPSSLLAQWCQAGAESLWGVADVLEGKTAFAVEFLPQRPQPRTTLLGALQQDLLGHPLKHKAATLPADQSLQILACPGIYREVETVYHSIVDNLIRQPQLQQTDIAVLVTDMPRYRPVLQAVFNRQPQHLRYNLADFSAAELSVFGHGVIGLIDLALESFTRSRVFATLLNPCFLARLGLNREQALVWLEWAEKLGVYHGWDRGDRQERGYSDSPLYSWRLGLQRLRLGRIMEVTDEDADMPASCYQGVVPYSDLLSSDKEQLNAFCRAVEGLLPVLTRLRNWTGTGEKWAGQIRTLVNSFLSVPGDRPEEEEVRGQLFRELEELSRLDALYRLQKRTPRLPLAFVREFVQTALECREGTKGQYLTGGVTISALQPLRPVPFEIIYILGLGEGQFPGSAARSALDLRTQHRCPGDILLPESNRFLLLETLLAARQKVYLLYNSKDAQSDRDLYPCSPLNQLQRHVKQKLAADFRPVAVPLCGNDLRYLQPEQAPNAAENLANYSSFERLLALAHAPREQGASLSPAQTAEIEVRLKNSRPDFTPPPAVASQSAGVQTVSVFELARFLRCPAEAALQRHLGLEDEDEIQPTDDEPFYLARIPGYRLARRFLQRFIRRAVEHDVDQALAQWPRWFEDLYEDWRLRGRAPDGAFARVDSSRFMESLRARIEGPGGLARFLKEHAAATFCAPVLIGESPTPIGARQSFPAVSLAPTGTAPGTVRLLGSQPFLWRSQSALELLVLTQSKSTKVPGDSLSVPMLEPLLFYLALRAGTEPNASGESSAQWLKSREFRLHLARPDGITTFTYLSTDFSQEQARNYLTELAQEFLLKTCFELLPFEITLRKPVLQLPFRKTEQEILNLYQELAHADEQQLKKIKKELGLNEDDRVELNIPDQDFLARLRHEYPGSYRDELEADGEDEHNRFYRPMKLLALLDTQVPDNAWEIMGRRFRLLDAGPARVREAAARQPGKGQKRGRR